MPVASNSHPQIHHPLRCRAGRFAIVWGGLVVLLLGLSTLLTSPVVAQNDIGSAGLETQQPPFPATIGVGNHVRLGSWTPVKILVGNDKQPSHYRISTIDGDNTPVQYTGQLQTDPERSGQVTAWFRLGRAVASIRIELFSSAVPSADETPANRIADWKLSIPGKSVLKSTQPLILVFGNQPTLTDAVRVAANTGDETVKPAVAQIDDLAELPFAALGYDSVQVAVFPVTSGDSVSQLTTAQLDALELWVRQGGKLVMSLSSEVTDLVASGGPLARFCPGDFTGPSEFSNSSRLESFANSKQQLIPIKGEPIPVARFENRDGKVVVSDGQQPLIIHHARGFGELVTVGFDLVASRLTEWESFSGLTSILVFGERPTSVDPTQGKSRNTVAHYGYTDLVGQLRVPLDQFSQVNFIAFTWIAILIGIYILCIGPLDWFVLRRLLGKMELTWITFPLMSLLFCGLAVAIAHWSRPADLQMNQLEVIDVDVTSGLCRGSVWTTLYSPTNQSIDLSLNQEHGVGFDIQQSWVSWQGLPGDGLGGMATQPLSALSRRPYQQPIGFSDDELSQSSLQSLPLQVSSSRSLFGRWWSENPFAIRSRPTLQTRSDRFTGVIKNPFDFELKNCRLLVDTWAYELAGTLGPGETFDIQTETREKTLRSSLTRRYRENMDDDRSISEPWNPASTRLERIAEVMMFYRAAGGDGYTGLSHGYQSFTDLSHHLDLNRAILIGEIVEPASELIMNEGALDAQFDKRTTMVRVILPVRVDPAR